MSELAVSAGFGVLGAVARVLVVSLRAVQMKRKIGYAGFWVYALVVLSAGAFSGIVLGYGKTIGFLAGYAGLDLLEGYYSVFRKKKVVVK